MTRQDFLMSRKRCCWSKAAGFWILFISCFVVASGGSFKYLGCYSDSSDLRDKSMTLDTMTLGDCCGMCQRSGYPYAGLQSMKTCYCGIVYDVSGKSSKECNYTSCATDTPHCGGYLSNDVYYSIDTSASKSFVKISSSTSFSKARMTCVTNGGDLACPWDTSSSSAIVAAASNDSSITSVWIGLYRRDLTNVSANYVWTDETLSSFPMNKTLYASNWASGDAMMNPCVALDIRTGKWSSIDCSTSLPFVCNQPATPPADTSTESSGTQDGSSDGVGSSSKRLALFIVLPLFLLCYGGSCILYCVHKIIRNCNRKKRSNMNLEDGQKNHPPGAREKIANPAVPPYRPLSASKRVAVYPAPQVTPAVMPIPSKFPMYVPANDLTGKSVDSADGLATARAVKIGMDEHESPPPKYIDRQEEKRARLLENASRESRMRREKEAEDGRPMSRPFTAPKREAAPGDDNSPTDDTLAESHGSTTNLLGKKDAAPPAGPSAGEPPNQPEGVSNMSISEILKQKMAQKADKKKPRKIIAA